MDGWFVVFIFVGVIAVLLGAVVPLTPKTNRNRGGFGLRKLLSGLFGVFVVLAVATLFMSSFRVIGAKQIGVPVTFGKPSGTVLHNGWNWKNPATAVHVFDASLQTEQYSSDKEDAGGPIQVRLFTGSVANVNVTFQWRLADDDSVTQVYLNYKDPERIDNFLVKRALQQALNEVFESYNPYAALIAAQNTAQNTPGTQQVSISYTDLQANALKTLKEELDKQGVEAVSLTIASIAYDGNTQHELDALGTAIAQTQVAIQAEKTAKAQAAANKTLNDSQATPTTLQQLCIQTTQKVLEEGHNLPAGWSCLGPSAATITAQAK